MYSTRNYAVDGGQHHQNDDAYLASLVALNNLSLSNTPEEIVAATRNRQTGYYPSLGYQSRYNNLSRLGGYTYQRAVQNIEIPFGRMFTILENPFMYMTCFGPDYYELNALVGERSYSFFREWFIGEVIKSNDSLVQAACTLQGSFLLQTLIKAAKHQPTIGLLAQALADDTRVLMTDQSGVHVVRTCFTELSSEKYAPFLINFMENDNWLTIAKSKQGCAGLNECLDYMMEPYKDNLIRRIVLFSRQLALDRYGTFVLQHVIDLQTIYTESIITDLIPFYVHLCTIKNGSHLVEKCLKTRYTSVVVKELIKCKKLVRIARHEYGNYVVQNAIEQTRTRENYCLHQELIRILYEDIHKLQNDRFRNNVANLISERA